MQLSKSFNQALQKECGLIFLMKKIYLNNVEFYLPKKIEKNIDVIKFSKKTDNEAKNIISKIGIRRKKNCS